LPPARPRGRQAAWADAFPHDAPAAFANVVAQSGLAASVGFFVFPHLRAGVVGALALGATAAGVAGFWRARAVLRAEQAHARLAMRVGQEYRECHCAEEGAVE
jgi:hypothetical protein